MSEGVNKVEFARLAGCDEKQVRRAIASGKLATNPDGSINPALVNSQWRRPHRATLLKAEAAKSDSPKLSGDAPKPGRPAVAVADDETPAQAAERLAAILPTAPLAESIAKKEQFLALTRELEYRQKVGELIERAVVGQVLFERGRRIRDAWMNWPTRVAPLIAADLGLDADRVAQVLTDHVHKHVASLGAPDPDDGR